VHPKLSATPGAAAWTGPDMGAHNDEIYTELLGIDNAELARLRKEGIV
jgi:formyl-CoA transferase